MIRSAICTLILVVLTFAATAQNGNFYDSSNQVLTQNRYDKVDGTPYLLGDWGTGVIYPLSGEPIKQSKINFNGATNKFDIVDGSNHIELNAALYNKIELSYEGESYTFINRIKPRAVANHVGDILGESKHGFSPLISRL